MLKRISNFLKAAVQKWLFTYDYDLQLMYGGKTPTRVYERDAGHDLYVTQSVTIPAGERKNLPTGVIMRSKIPAWILITGRSSTLLRYGIIVDGGIIDGDFIGELYIKAFNSTKEEVHIPPDTRIAQIIVLPHTSIRFNRVKWMSKIDGARNEHGHGSSGK